jgi:hypothetical protein
MAPLSGTPIFSTFSNTLEEANDEPSRVDWLIENRWPKYYREGLPLDSVVHVFVMILWKKFVFSQDAALAF